MGSCPCCFSPSQSNITALLCPGLTVGSTTPPHLFSPLLALPPSLQEDTCFKSRPGVKSSVLSKAPMVHGHAHAPGRSELPGQREASSSWSITVFQSYQDCGNCGCFESLWFVSGTSWHYSRSSDSYWSSLCCGRLSNSSPSKSHLPLLCSVGSTPVKSLSLCL